MKENSMKIFGLILVIFSIVSFVRLGIQDIKIIGLTPEKCTGEATGYIVDTVYGTQMRYGGGSHSMYENYYDVYYDVIDYEVNGEVYEITSRHAQNGNPVIGAQTQVYYNPENPAQAYDNSPPGFNEMEYFYPLMILIIGIALIFRLDKLLKK